MTSNQPFPALMIFELCIWLIPGWINGTLQTHLGQNYAAFLGIGLEPLVQNLTTMLVLWSVCWWMFRNRIFLRI